MRSIRTQRAITTPPAVTVRSAANTTGSGNIALGVYAGSILTIGNNNIDIGNQGVAGESNTIRIGTTGLRPRPTWPGSGTEPLKAA